MIDFDSHWIDDGIRRLGATGFLGEPIGNSTADRIRYALSKTSGKVFFNGGYYFTVAGEYFSISHKRGASPEAEAAWILPIVDEFGRYERIHCHLANFWAYQFIKENR